MDRMETVADRLRARKTQHTLIAVIAAAGLLLGLSGIAASWYSLGRMTAHKRPPPRQRVVKAVTVVLPAFGFHAHAHTWSHHHPDFDVDLDLDVDTDLDEADLDL